MAKGLLLVISIFLFIAPCYQDKKQPKTNDKDIDNAIKKGTSWLLGKLDTLFKKSRIPPKNITSSKCEELILYTLAHAGIKENNDSFKRLLQMVLATKPGDKRTYNLCVEIMALTAIDKKKYKERLIECAQALVNGQAKNGQWWYDIISKKSEDADSDKTPSTHDKKVIKRQKWCGDKGDNSNSQYAALAIRACFESGIEFDSDILKLAKESWEKGQNDDGGWSYVQSNGKAPSYGSMTVGGLSSLASYKSMLKEDIKKDSHIEKAIEWVTKNYAIDKNPEYKGTFGKYWHYYYLYGLERVGALAELEKLGDHDWYKEGADHLIKNQESNGHWNSEKKNKKVPASSMDDVEYVDTCFAILFLKRATELLIETGK